MKSRKQLKVPEGDEEERPEATVSLYKRFLWSLHKTDLSLVYTFPYDCFAE